MQLSLFDDQQAAATKLHLSTSTFFGDDDGRSKTSNNKEPLFAAGMLVADVVVAGPSGGQLHEGGLPFLGGQERKKLRSKSARLGELHN